MHRWDVYFEENEINYLPFRKNIFTNINCVYSISNDGKEYYNFLSNNNNNLNICISKLGVLQNGINKTCHSTKIEILSISNLIPIKNIKLLISALSLLKIDFEWSHIGDGNLKTELESIAKRLIPGKYKFLGNVSNTEVLQYLKNTSVDVFINVSLSEGIPVSIMEAMSFGIPVIATAVGGTPEIVNNKNGFLLSENPSKEDVAKKIEEFYYLSKVEKEEKRQSAYDTWNNEYNAEKNYTDFVSKILSL